MGHRGLFSLSACLLLGAASCAEDILRTLATKTDEFSQNVAAKVDILWVVDSSESMAQEQEDLGNNFDTFIQSFVTSGVDYHIGVISMDPGEGGRLHAPSGVYVIDPATNNPAATFLDNVKVGLAGARQEKAFESAALALGKGPGWTPGSPPQIPPTNLGFLRDEAALFIIMVSDEDDSSFGPPRYYSRLFESYKGPGNEARVSVSAIAGPPSDPSGCAAPGERYAEIVSLDVPRSRAGIFTSICEEFSTSLGQLSISATGLASVFELSSVPNTGGQVECDTYADYLCVRENGRPVPHALRAGWSYPPEDDLSPGATRANAVVFGVDALPKPEAKITVEYQERR